MTLPYLCRLRDEYEELVETVGGGRHPWARGTHVLRAPWDGEDLTSMVEPVLSHVRRALS